MIKQFTHIADPEIKTIAAKQLAGICIRTNLAQNQNFELWSRFMPQRSSIPNQIGASLYSIEFFDEVENFHAFTALTFFTKWAAVEVSITDKLPEGISTLNLVGGLYAAIYTQWLPQSGYQADHNRAQFEVMGEKYKRDDDTSEEEVFIPIREKL
jgi:AraC family transcriptional regulator